MVKNLSELKDHSSLFVKAEALAFTMIIVKERDHLILRNTNLEANLPVNSEAKEDLATENTNQSMTTAENKHLNQKISFFPCTQTFYMNEYNQNQIKTNKKLVIYKLNRILIRM